MFYNLFKINNLLIKNDKNDKKNENRRIIYNR
jgi:hypothetical protein